MTAKELIESYAAGNRDFRDANLGNADLSGANLCNTNLCNTNLCNANLSGANLRSADLSNADLGNADLRNADLRDADLSNADLRNADLRNADLSNADLRNADLSGANLRDANLSNAVGIPSKLVAVRGLDQKMARVCKKPRSLEMSTWHSCKTKHCRAGWAITMLGEKGKLLEEIYGPATAGALIYHASTGRIPNFYDTNDGAMEDILACAKKAVSK